MPGARRIAVTVEFGGKKLIRVEDDGEGMEPEDARLAIERHATSKIRRSDDLARIATLGFRGEALPSIASVSHFVLRSRARGAGVGHRGPREWRDHRLGDGSRHAGGHVDRGRRCLLQPAGTPQVPQVRWRRVGPGLAHRHAAGLVLSGGRLHADQLGAQGAAGAAGRDAARPPVSVVRRSERPGRRPPRHR